MYRKSIKTLYEKYSSETFVKELSLKSCLVILKEDILFVQLRQITELLGHFKISCWLKITANSLFYALGLLVE